MDAVIYIRWSSTEQTKGSSLARQRQLCRDHCARKGWNIIREERDEGVSAWTGRNAIEGSLAKIIDDVDSGALPHGVVLVVEQLDRLSRRPVIDMFDWLRSTVSKGIRIATVVGDGYYETGSFDLTTIIKVAVEADVAHRQSQDKSAKLTASWEVKRAKQARGELGVLTRRAPAWLTVEGTPPRFAIIEDRAEIVRRIFGETVAGYGKHTIARRLNQEGISTFGRAEGWHSSYVQKILNSQTVLGEMQPGRKPRGKARELVGDPIRDYYPAIVDADLYARAHHSMATRSRRVAGRGRRLVNLFSGLARCAECGAIMTFRGKGAKLRANGELVNEDYLVCDSYQRGRGCGNRQHYNYSVWQEGVLSPVLLRAMRDDHFTTGRDVRALEIEVAEMVRRRDAAKRKGETALAFYLENPREERKAAYVRLEAEADECDAALVVLRRQVMDARGIVSPEEHQARISELYDQMDDADEDVRFGARSRIMEAVHDLIDTILFGVGPSAQVMAKGGGKFTMEPNPADGPRSFFYEFWDFEVEAPA